MITAKWLLDSILIDVENAIKNYDNGCSSVKVKEDLKVMAIYYNGIKDALAEDKEEAAPTGNDKMNLVYRWIKVINELAIKASANVSSTTCSTASKDSYSWL